MLKSQQHSNKPKDAMNRALNNKKDMKLYPKN